MKELKKGENMKQTIKKIKNILENLFKSSESKKVCNQCGVLNEIEELKKSLIEDKAFDISQDGEVII